MRGYLLCALLACLCFVFSFQCALFGGGNKKPTTYECERAKRVCREANRYRKANKDWGIYNTNIEDRQKMADWECEEAKMNCDKSLREPADTTPSHPPGR